MLQDVAAATIKPPAALTLALSVDTGTSGSDHVTSVASLAPPSGVESGDTLAYSLDGGKTYTSTYTAPTANGSYTVLVTQTDILGQSSAPSSLSFTLDTTAPTASSVTDTVTRNSGPAPIGIAAPTDNLTAAGSLTIVTGALPSDGTVTLADGITPVTANEFLTSAQLQSLEFTPTPGASGQSSTFSYTVTDAAGNQSAGTATLNVAYVPTIGGTMAGQQTANDAPVSPFQRATVTDGNNGVDTLTVQLTSGGTASGANGTLAESDSQYALTSNGNGLYTLATGSASAVQAELQALVFTPTPGTAGSATTTGFTLVDASTVGPTRSAPDATTTVTDTVAPAPSTPTPVAPATGGATLELIPSGLSRSG